MREDIKVNLEREVNARIKARNKEAVMDALVKHTEMDVPKVMIEQDSQRLAEQTRQDMAQRGMDVKSLPFPADLFATKAERRVRLGLILSQLVGQQPASHFGAGQGPDRRVRTELRRSARSPEVLLQRPPPPG
jgi:trigger factor